MDPSKTRKVIAVVTDAFAPFHREVVDLMRPLFSAAGYGTLAVTGRDVRTDRLIEAVAQHTDGQGEFGTRLAVSGAVVVCGATPPTMSDAAIAEYVGRLTDGPVVSFGIRLPGVPSVTIAWDQAIAELMSHMVLNDFRKNFVFIRGFSGDPHSKTREVGFRKGIAAAGLEVDEDLVVSGHYSVADAMNAVTQLLDDGHKIDGIVAANDDMAVGALAALAARGISVPRDVIVSGFDDSLASFGSDPQLTTVLLDTESLSATAAKLLIDAIDSNVSLHPDLEVKHDSGLIVRDSTCPGFGPPPVPHMDSQADIRAHLLEQIRIRWEAHRAPAHLDVGGLISAAVQTLMTGDGSLAIAHRQAYADFQNLMRRSELIWNKNAIRQLRSIALEAGQGLVPEHGMWAVGDQLKQIDQLILPATKVADTEALAHRQLQERLLMGLASCSGTDTLWETLRAGLQAFDMKNAWVALNNESPEDRAEPMMRLVFSLGEEQIPSTELFPRASVLPERFDQTLEQGLHVLVPLRAGNSEIGYIVLEPSGEYLVELEAIATGIAQVLRHVEQVGDLEHQTSRLRLANEALDHLARRDSLTGLANRKLFLENLEQQIDSAGTGAGLSVLFFDLDGFKQINDTLGHEAGDHLLRIVANRVTELLSDADTFARLGGDEFIISLSHAKGSSKPGDIAGAILHAISETCILTGQKTNMSASLGLATYPADGTTTEELVGNADSAMYTAKAAGKNGFAYYADGLAAETDHELELREALRIGLDNDEFYLNFQPRFCLSNGRIQAFDGLLRWNSSVELAPGDTRPDRFIVVAERNGLISDLDSVSLDRACREAKRWFDGGFAMPVSVNMSVKRLQEADIASQVDDALQRYGLGARTA